MSTVRVNPAHSKTLDRVASLPRRDVVALVLVTLGGLILRLALFGSYTFQGTDCDGAAYMDLAQNLAQGAGWVTHSLRFLFLLPESLPQPDAHWSPLYPLLTAASYRVFGDSFAAAKLVPLLFGALLPAMIYLLTASLTRSYRAAVIAGVLAACHPTLVTWSLRIETEIVSVFFTALTFTLLFSARASARPYWVGLALGLAYLAKYQAALLWAPVAAYAFMTTPWRTALRRLAVTAAVFVLVVSPWLIRNALTFGNPLYTDLRYSVISYYPEFAPEARYLTSLAMPMGTLEYFRTHTDVVAQFAKAGLRFLLAGFVTENRGSVLLIPFALAGLVGAARAWRKWAAALMFVVPLLVFISVSIPQIRYIHVFIPVWIALVATGANWVLERVGKRRVLVAAVGLVLLAGAVDEMRSGVTIAHAKNVEWSPSANYCALEAQAASAFIRDHTTPTDAVFAPEPFHYALILGRNVIQVPFEEDALRRLAELYDARYLAITTRDLRRRLPAWESQAPSWARLVLTVPAAEIPRPAANPTYRHVGELRIYALSIP